ncbi:unnamed protein product [Adineta steineri]|uniref:Uncharacterized protein n=1 Tax=Adineta steineri TaxID=433720 RepID=A0A815QAQ4_9BILA|nr:unnamed protein product [Adineta steineri]
MNANNNSHEEILQLSSQDVSGHKDEPSNIQQQQQLKKKKCRGNRKEQRNRKRLCRQQQQQQQQMNANTTRMVQDIINNDDVDSQYEHNQIYKQNKYRSKRRLKNKRKHLDLNKNNLLVDQFILSPRNLIEESRSSYPIRTYRKKLKRYNMSTDHWKQTSKLLPNYKQLSPFKFKHLLLKAISNEYRNELNQLLNNIATLQFIKKRAELLCMVFRLKIEQDYWNYIGTLNMPTITWLSLKTSKVIIKQNFINWDHTKTIAYIQRQQNKINNKLQKAIFNLYVHFEQAFPLNEQILNVMSLDDLSKIIYSALAIILEKSLHYFHLNFEQKEILLCFDIQDAYLVKSFFDLNPTLEQVS